MESGSPTPPMNRDATRFMFARFRTAERSFRSPGGGRLARWRQDTKELFYRALDGRLMAAPVRTTIQGLEFGAAIPLISTMEPAGAFAYPYDISPDGQRNLALAPVVGAARVVLLPGV